MATTDRAAQLILASSSAIRRQLLANAGLTFSVEAAAADEATEMARLGVVMPEALAEYLAEWKALDVSARNPAALVVGCDQVLALDGKSYTKAADLAIARQALMELRGKTHFLHSAVTLVKDGAVLWRYLDSARLTMRDFSSGFVDGYLARTGNAVLKSVGSYQLEGVGVQLFERIEGDYFTILGLPLLPLLAELRRHGVVAT